MALERPPPERRPARSVRAVEGGGLVVKMNSARTVRTRGGRAGAGNKTPDGARPKRAMAGGRLDMKNPGGWSGVAGGKIRFWALAIYRIFDGFVNYIAIFLIPIEPFLLIIMKHMLISLYEI